MGETFSTGGHTPDLILVFAYSPGAEAFAGIYDKMLEATHWLPSSSNVAAVKYV
ncbi:MAG: hypothetical protein AAF992_19980 [Bacteroidota bacterium]